MSATAFKPVTRFAALLAGLGFTMMSLAQAPAGGPPAGGGGPPGGMPSPADQAIEYRKALFTVIAGNFSPLGGILRGNSKFDANVLKRAERTAMLATMVPEAFPDISKTGDTKAKAEVWTDTAGFAKVSQDFADASNNLLAVLRKNNADSAEFRDAAGKVGESCKGCHEKFRAR